MCTGHSNGESCASTMSGQTSELLTNIFDVMAEKNAAATMLFPNGINYIHFKLDVTGLGSVDLEISGVPKASPGPARMLQRSDFAASAPAPVPCAPADATAARIKQTCEDVYDANKGDCNLFVKAASGPYFGNLFGDQDADQIIATLSDGGSGWALTTSIDAAIDAATGGAFVIAGMTSAQLGESHGHLAVVVGCPAVQASRGPVPVGYAGSLGKPGSPIEGIGLNWTFPAVDVSAEKVSYFSKAPTV